MQPIARSLFLAAVLITGCPVRGQLFIGNTQVDTNVVASGLDTPWEILWGPDDWIWFTERPGRVSRLNPATGEIRPLAEINEVHEQGEAGLLGMALHPDFPEEPYVYLTYIFDDGSRIMERVVRYTYDNDLLSDEQILFSEIRGARTHNGSRLTFGRDGKLYISTGDSQDTSLPQNANSPNGKVLRMNPDGSAPEDNPQQGSLIWTLGHRNPQGLVFSPDGILYSSEHGPDSDDEINIIEKGRNYGWPDVEGFCDTSPESTFCAANNVREPLAAWTPTLAVAGLDYYDHGAIPEWQNSLLLTTLKNKTLINLKLSGDGLSITSQANFLNGIYGRLRDLCISPDGRVFLATSNQDGIGTSNPGDDKIIEIRSGGISTLIPGTLTGRLDLFPNPMDETMIIRMTGLKGKKTIQIYSLDGSLMRKVETTQNQVEFHKDDLPSGYYLIRAGNDRISLRGSFVVR